MAEVTIIPTSGNVTEDVALEDHWPLYIHICAGFLISLMSLFAVGGNILTVTAYVLDKQLHEAYNVYIINLAITDLGIGLFSVPFYAVYTLEEFSWPLGAVFCKIYMVIDFTLCTQSVILMVLISYDRYLLLKYGATYQLKQTIKKAWIHVFMAWLLSFLMHSPMIIFWDIWMGYSVIEDGECDVEFYDDESMTIYEGVTEFGLPLVLLISLNSLVWVAIRKRMRAKKVHPTDVATGYVISSIQTHSRQILDHTSPIQSVPDRVEIAENKIVRPSRKRQDLHAAKYLGSLVLVFAVCWFPYVVTTIMLSFCYSCVDIGFYEFLNFLLWLKSSINPFLYALNSSRFKQNFKKLICPKRR